MADYLINLFGNTIPGELTVFILSMVPLVELRGGILAAKALNVEMWKAFLLCAAGTMVPIPFILLFIRQIMEWLKNTRLVKVVDKLEAKAEQKIKKIEKYKTLGLVIFVAIPLPGTGAWTGALVASFLGLSPKKSMLPVTLGVITAGTIVMLSTMGVLNVIK